MILIENLWLMPEENELNFASIAGKDLIEKLKKINENSILIKQLYFLFISLHILIHTSKNIDIYDELIEIICGYSSYIKDTILSSNKQVAAIFWEELLSHDNQGRRIDSGKCIRILKKQYNKDDYILYYLEDKASIHIPTYNASLPPSYLFQSDTFFDSRTIKFNAYISEEKIQEAIKLLVTYGSLRDFYKTHELEYENLVCSRKEITFDKNHMLYKPKYIYDNYKDIVDADNYYLLLNTADTNRFINGARFIHLLNMKKKNNEYEYISISQKQAKNPYIKDLVTKQTNFEKGNFPNGLSTKEMIYQSLFSEFCSNRAFINCFKNIEAINSIEDIKTIISFS